MLSGALGWENMVKRLAIATVSALTLTSFAHADFLSWSAETEDDPFSDEQKVTVDYMSTFRSGLEAPE